MDAYVVKRLVIPPRSERPYRSADWRGALAVIESGALELESRHGVRCRFQRGDVLALEGLQLRGLRNPGEVRAVVAMTFRAPGV